MSDRGLPRRPAGSQLSANRGAVLGTLLALFILTGCATPPEEPASTPWRYALVIDASSSASTLFVFQWRETEDRDLPWIEAAPYPRDAGEQAWEKRVKPGLGAYAGKPLEAARSLEPLVDFALEKIGDATALAETTLHLRATAGLRLMEPAQRDEIAQGVRDYLATTPFGSTSTRVITGVEEGIYGWLSVNYMLGHLEHGGRFPTVGALDLGGASTQITFAPLDHPREHSRSVTVGGNTYQLYTYSYLGRGQDRARDDMATPACFLKNYPLEAGDLGTGDWDACRRAIRAKLPEPCGHEPCSMFDAYQPPLYGDFLAFSVYAYAADFFELPGRLSPADLEAAGSAFCAQDWQQLVIADPSAADNPFLPDFCFTAAYIVTLLTDVYGLPSTTERVHAQTRVQGAEVGWALGALLYELAGEGD